LNAAVVGNGELKTLLAECGLRPQQASVHQDLRGASKGVATARFSRKANTELAISVLSRRIRAGKTLTTHIETNSTVIGSFEPLVVDGTNKTGASSVNC
jgi:hypothetical protein